MDFESGTYQLYKLIHVAGGIILLGNIIVTAVWKTLADVTKEPKIVAYAQRLMTITDFAFTLVGVLLVLGDRLHSCRELRWCERSIMVD